MELDPSFSESDIYITICKMLAGGSSLPDIMTFANATTFNPDCDLQNKSGNRKVFFMAQPNADVRRDVNYTIDAFGGDLMKQFIINDIINRKQNGERQLVNFQQFLKILLEHQCYKSIKFKLSETLFGKLGNLVTQHVCKNESFHIYEEGLVYAYEDVIHIQSGKIKTAAKLEMYTKECKALKVERFQPTNVWSPWNRADGCEIAYRIKIIAMLLCFNLQYPSCKKQSLITD